MASAFRHVGVRMIDGLVKKAQVHPIEQMRATQQYGQGLQDIKQELGLANTQFPMAGNEDYYRRVKELYDRFLGPRPAAEKAPKVISVPK